MRIDRALFFASVRDTVYAGRMTGGQVQGLNNVLDVAEARYPAIMRQWLAYCLATAHHETAFTMQPVRERGGAEYFLRRYDPRSPDPKMAARAVRMGAKPGDGPVYFGRGHVQLTWGTNYLRFERLLGIPLFANPDLALEPEVSVRVLIEGSIGGLFTGKKLGDYIVSGRTDYVGARKVINGTDKAEDIASYAVSFDSALTRSLTPR